MSARHSDEEGVLGLVCSQLASEVNRTQEVTLFGDCCRMEIGASVRFDF